MDIRAVEKAKSRLRLANKAIAELAECKSYSDFVDCWYAYLTASKNVWTVLEQGAKATPQSRQWFGGKEAQRRQDELLQYLYEARNDDEHGIEPITRLDPGGLQIGVRKPGYSSSMVVDGTIGPGGSFAVKSLDGLPILVEARCPTAQLATVRARGHRLLQPPATHKGGPVEDNSPLPIAKLGLAYLEELVAEAARRAS